MNFWSIFAIGIGLSMDAFAVSVCKGLGMQKLNVWQMATISLFFAVFQFLMPILGYYVCVNFESYVVSFDHWIAFILLGFLGAKMIFEAFKDDKEDKLKKTEKSDGINKLDSYFLVYKRYSSPFEDKKPCTPTEIKHEEKCEKPKEQKQKLRDEKGSQLIKKIKKKQL